MIYFKYIFIDMLLAVILLSVILLPYDSWLCYQLACI